MISYQRDAQQTIPESSVKIIGLGGAGANMLDRTALDGLSGAEMMCVNTDMRTLSSSVANEKVQIGRHLTKGLGAGGDPEVGLKAAQESEQEIRDALRDRQMVFLCVGLGGGTGSGAAPLICRLAREEGAFVVVFATMPFAFEGARRRTQAETSLNELAVLANALVTFDNDRMGELVLAKQGIHEAFAAADQMISESVKAVTRLVMRPGLVNVGLDDLMTALRTNRSRCLFGSGIAKGEDRTQRALENTLSSPLLDKGSLLEDATTVLVHICGGESLTLYEVELLMQGLAKYVPATAHILFGAAVDQSMGESLSVTLVSALPENKLIAREDEVAEVETVEEESAAEEVVQAEALALEEEVELAVEDESEEDAIQESVMADEEPDPVDDTETEEGLSGDEDSDKGAELEAALFEAEEADSDDSDELEDTSGMSGEQENDEDAPEEENEFEEESELAHANTVPVRAKASDSQAELELDGGPKGRFEGETPNFLDGEDLDIPPFLRKKRH